jgi:hypothetical protein
MEELPIRLIKKLIKSKILFIGNIMLMVRMELLPNSSTIGTIPPPTLIILVALQTLTIGELVKRLVLMV